MTGGDSGRAVGEDMDDRYYHGKTVGKIRLAETGKAGVNLTFSAFIMIK